MNLRTESFPNFYASCVIVSEALIAGTAVFHWKLFKMDNCFDRFCLSTFTSVAVMPVRPSVPAKFAVIPTNPLWVRVVGFGLFFL
jgi:hypothetical protein